MPHQEIGSKHDQPVFGHTHFEEVEVHVFFWNHVMDQIPVECVGIMALQLGHVDMP